MTLATDATTLVFTLLGQATLAYVGGDLSVSSNKKLRTLAQAFPMLKRVDGVIRVNGNPVLEDFDGFDVCSAQNYQYLEKYVEKRFCFACLAGDWTLARMLALALCLIVVSE